ncbi:MAG TPA: DNA-3-methyladenine glycosylase 2 family protein [Dongiaceae bacterium]|nr:DNA-3-methyladenine glycosylase 2 family protein [Dongiaceae bacterium]
MKNKSLKDICHLDSLFADIHQRHGPPPQRTMPTGFPGLMQIVMGQQISTSAARAIHGRLVALLGNEVTPQRFLRASEAELRQAGLSGPKILRCRTIAEAIDTGALSLAEIEAMDDEAAIEALIVLPGIGRWSAEMYLLFGLNRPDIWPAGDLAIQVALQKLKRMRARPDEAKLRQLGRKWRPYRSLAARMLWHAYGAMAKQDKMLV